MRKNKSPTLAGCRARKEKVQTASVYPPLLGAVKRYGFVCGQCSMFRAESRKFCAFLGESVRASEACIVDPLSGGFLTWIAEEERREREETL